MPYLSHSLIVPRGMCVGLVGRKSPEEVVTTGSSTLEQNLPRVFCIFFDFGDFFYFFSFFFLFSSFFVFWVKGRGIYFLIFFFHVFLFF